MSRDALAEASAAVCGELVGLDLGVVAALVAVGFRVELAAEPFLFLGLD
eukprot:CAMPEP_0184099872 /NCGR_PEP_ID=MMETSP0974-20121125/12045_1 /TAXON_ID=483370 /ORGANISM="non described non described, Strain CCMP2097" /LENGTH=48 /DNA_ID= /DNA_START= /DNA_END= /DNA_ORIENTATION=